MMVMKQKGEGSELKVSKDIKKITEGTDKRKKDSSFQSFAVF